MYFLLPEDWGRLETNPQNVISLGPAVSEVQIILEQEKKTILTKTKGKLYSGGIDPRLDPVETESRTVK